MLIIANKLPKARRFMVILLAITGCAIIAINGRQLGLLSAMLHLLSLSYALKTLELNSRKDFYQFIVLGLFICAGAFLFQQSLGFSVMVALAVIINFAVLLQYFSINTPYHINVKQSTKMLLQSLPLAIVLFVVFPRLEPFWQVPMAKSATTGLSDNVAPGDIANLAKSNELAFRVNFIGDIPAYPQRYWRALVMDEYTGKQWQRSRDKKLSDWLDIRNNQSFSPTVSGPAFDYQVIAEPSFKRWLFALDVAKLSHENRSVSSINMRPDYSLQNKNIISKAISYDVSSFYTTAMDVNLNPLIRHRTLNYPKGSNPKLEQEGQRLKQAFKNPQAIIKNVLARFSEQAYYYTLKPPLLQNNSLDQFYFSTKAGFCAHYASAFTFLMRAAGIPARMVTGYMGGEYNPDGNYFSIYQSDAHAWSEVWLEGKGWQRIDPTAAVDPLRVEQGFSESLSAEQNSLNNEYFNLRSYKSFQLLNTLRLKLATIDYQWTLWVVGYSSKKQFDLLSSWFGRMTSWKTGLIMAISLIFVMFMLWYLQRHQRVKHKQKPWLNLYQQGLALLAKHNLHKNKSVAVIAFSDHVFTISDGVLPAFRALSRDFSELEYRQASPQRQKQLVLNMQQHIALLKTQLRHYKAVPNQTDRSV